MALTTIPKTIIASPDDRPDLIGPDVVCVADFQSEKEADELRATITMESEFKQNYIHLYGVKAIPRLEAWYGSWDYEYSKGVVLKAAPMPGYLQILIDRLKERGFGGYNAVLVNRYRSGQDYISPHSDDDYGDPGPTIPSLTLGATRPFKMARIVPGSVPKKLDMVTTVTYLPAHGSLLVMRGRTNLEWQHWVPKTSKPVGERINLTFRYKPLG